MRHPWTQATSSNQLFNTFLKQLLRHYIFGSAVAVLGVGSVMIFSTLKLSCSEIMWLALILLSSILIMFLCELYVFNRHILPIKAVFDQEHSTSQQLKKAYWQLHRFPLLSVKRIFGPHFLGMSIPAILMAYLFISLDLLSLPVHYIGLASAGALLVASLHAMIEFFLTARATRSVIIHVRQMHLEQYKQDLTLGGQVLVSIKRKFLLSAFMIGTLPMLLFSLATQIRIEGISSSDVVSYWQWAALILVIGILFSMLGAFLLARDIQAPIESLQQAMAAVQAGDFDYRAEDTYSDEFSRLVEGFNHMVDGLKEREKRNNQLLQSYFITLAATLDARDHYTAGHSQRVAEYAVQIGRLAGWEAADIDTLHKSALLHDIGKIGVRDAVLLKEGKLTEEEFDQIKLHPILGENILKRIEPADAMAELLPGVRSHHERHDGRGYPDGLSGEDIPQLGKVIALADAYDAMTSNRPYRMGMTKDRAISILEAGSGSQWDPQYTKLFIHFLRGQRADTCSHCK